MAARSAEGTARSSERGSEVAARLLERIARLPENWQHQHSRYGVEHAITSVNPAIGLLGWRSGFSFTDDRPRNSNCVETTSSTQAQARRNQNSLGEHTSRHFDRHGVASSDPSEEEPPSCEDSLGEEEDPPTYEYVIEDGSPQTPAGHSSGDRFSRFFHDIPSRLRHHHGPHHSPRRSSSHLNLGQSSLRGVPGLQHRTRTPIDTIAYLPCTISDEQAPPPSYESHRFYDHPDSPTRPDTATRVAIWRTVM